MWNDRRLSSSKRGPPLEKYKHFICCGFDHRQWELKAGDVGWHRNLMKTPLKNQFKNTEVRSESPLAARPSLSVDAAKHIFLFTGLAD